MSGLAQIDDPKSPVEDRELIDRCLAGDPIAWDALYARFHGSVVLAVQRMLPLSAADVNFVDEVAARVWYAAVTNGGELLARFDPDRGFRLGTMLSAIARNEAIKLSRSERRRKQRETEAAKWRRDPAADSCLRQEVEIDDFMKSLTEGEARFCRQVLLLEGGAKDYSMANAWQLRSRIRRKLSEFVARKSQ